jgi:hypothetical protein
MKVHRISLEKIRKDLIKSQGEEYANSEIVRIRFCAEEKGLVYFLAREKNCVPESVLWADTEFIASKFGKNAERLNDGHFERMKEFESDLKKYEGNELTEQENKDYKQLCEWFKKNRGHQQTLGQLGVLKRVKITDEYKKFKDLEDKEHKDFMYKRTKDKISRGKQIVCKLVF